MRLEPILNNSPEPTKGKEHYSILYPQGKHDKAVIPIQTVIEAGPYNRMTCHCANVSPRRPIQPETIILVVHRLFDRK